MTPDITDSEVMTALRDFLMLLFEDVPVILAQTNRVPPPKGAFIAMTKTAKRRLATNFRTYTDPGTTGTQNTQMATEYTVQLDFYGEGSGERVQTFCTLFFDYYGCDNFAENVKPLYVDEPQQIPLISGEKEYIERWTVSPRLQYNPVVQVPMDFFDSPEIALIPVPLNEE